MGLLGSGTTTRARDYRADPHNDEVGWETTVRAPQRRTAPRRSARGVVSNGGRSYRIHCRAPALLESHSQHDHVTQRPRNPPPPRLVLRLVFLSTITGGAACFDMRFLFVRFKEPYTFSVLYSFNRSYCSCNVVLF